eukprot:COSAG02_NODE_277_length_25939_cov_108.963971_3_plen_86_part_00
MVRKHDLGRDLPRHQEIRDRLQTPPKSNGPRIRVPETRTSEYDASALHTTPRPRRMNQVQPRVDSWSFRSKKPTLNQQVRPLVRW